MPSIVVGEFLRIYNIFFPSSHLAGIFYFCHIYDGMKNAGISQAKKKQDLNYCFC